MGAGALGCQQNEKMNESPDVAIVIAYPVS